MNVVEPRAEILHRAYFSPCEFVEKIGRTCYMSEDKISAGSAETFVRNVGKRKHYAMFEHLWIYFRVSKPFDEYSPFLGLCNSMRHNTGQDLSAFVHSFNIGDSEYVATNIRVIAELIDHYGVTIYDHARYRNYFYVLKTVANEYPDFFKEEVLKYESDRVEVYSNADAFYNAIRNDRSILLSKEELDVIRRETTTHTVRFYVDRGVTHELVRHRVASFAQESTRYVKYGELNVIKPCYLEEDSEAYGMWKIACSFAEKQYARMRDLGCSPQEARAVLPTSLASEIVVTANEIEWQHIIDLRYKGTTGAPHPQMKQAIGLVVKELCAESEGRLSYE